MEKSELVKHYRKNDLNECIKEFVNKQLLLLKIERDEEEKQTLDNIYQYTARVYY